MHPINRLPRRRVRPFVVVIHLSKVMEQFFIIILRDFPKGNGRLGPASIHPSIRLNAIHSLDFVGGLLSPGVVLLQLRYLTLLLLLLGIALTRSVQCKKYLPTPHSPDNCALNAAAAPSTAENVLPSK